AQIHPQITCFSLHDALPILKATIGWLTGTREVRSNICQLKNKSTEAATPIEMPIHNCFPLFLPEILLCRKLFHSLFTSGFKDTRSEEHTSELQSRFDLVCRL